MAHGNTKQATPPPVMAMGTNHHFPMVGYLDPEDVVDARTYAVTERFLVLATNILANEEIDQIGSLHRLVDEFMDHLDDWQE